MINPADPVGSLIAGLANLLTQWYAGLVGEIVKFLFVISVPSPDQLVHNFFSLSIGGTLGLASRVIVLIAVIAALIIALTPARNHGKKISRVLTSMTLLALFGYFFYPLYSLLYALSQGLTEAALDLANGSSNGTTDALIKLFSGLTVLDVFSKLVTGLLSGTFGFFTFGEAITLRILLFVILIFYPLILALRPLGGVANTIFHAANSAIITVVVSPPVMGFFFTLPLLVQKYIPGGNLPGFAMFPAIIGAVLASVVPLALAFFAYKGSSEVFGSIDAMGGRFDVGSMPPVTIDDVNKDIDETHNSPFKDVATDVIGDGMLNGTLFSDMRKTFVDGVASTSAAMGHPYVGMAVKGVDGYLRQRQEKKTGGQDSATGQTTNLPPEGGDDNA